MKKKQTKFCYVKHPNWLAGRSHKWSTLHTTNAMAYFAVYVTTQLIKHEPDRTWSLDSCWPLANDMMNMNSWYFKRRKMTWPKNPIAVNREPDLSPSHMTASIYVNAGMFVEWKQNDNRENGKITRERKGNRNKAVRVSTNSEAKLGI